MYRYSSLSNSIDTTVAVRMELWFSKCIISSWLRVFCLLHGCYYEIWRKESRAAATDCSRRFDLSSCSWCTCNDTSCRQAGGAVEALGIGRDARAIGCLSNADFGASRLRGRVGEPATGTVHLAVLGRSRGILQIDQPSHALWACLP